MLLNTQGIVIHTLKFSETSIIAKIYTELFGLQTYLVKGIRNPKARLKAGLFQPLTILDLSVYHKEKSTLQHLKDARHAAPYQSIPFDIRKSSIALFIDELIYKTIREEETHPELFRFLYNSCIILDEIKEGFGHFHLLFAIRLTEYLGLMPHNNYSSQKRIFDLQEGHFCDIIPSHHNCLNNIESFLFQKLLSVPVNQWINLPFNSEERDLILEKIILYYKVHLQGFNGLQSHQVLRTVLS